MKFAIYGDSYAAAQYNNVDLNQHSWATQLAHRMGASTCDYYAAAGSSFFYSYRKIMETADQYDRIIVAVTEPMRYTRQVHNRFISGIAQAQHEQGTRHAELQRLQGWFFSLDFEFMQLAQQLLVDHVQQLHPTAVLVPCFSTSLTGAVAQPWQGFSLNNIALRAVELCNQDPERLTEIHSSTGIICHMPADWQTAVADLVYNKLKNNRLDDIDQWQLARDRHSYFK
jgi:hypothetical protein